MNRIYKNKSKLRMLIDTKCNLSGYVDVCICCRKPDNAFVAFTVTIPPEQRDKTLGDKLIAENSGILNWLIEGYAMWKKEGLSNEPDAVKEANEEYKLDMDSVGTFVADCFEIDASLKWRLHTRILYETYIKWCNKNNERVMSQKWLGMRMQEKGFKRLATNGQRVWLGLVVKNE